MVGGQAEEPGRRGRGGPGVGQEACKGPSSSWRLLGTWGEGGRVSPQGVGQHSGRDSCQLQDVALLLALMVTFMA